jgi:hypothetical protein
MLTRKVLQCEIHRKCTVSASDGNISADHQSIRRNRSPEAFEPGGREFESLRAHQINNLQRYRGGSSNPSGHSPPYFRADQIWIDATALLKYIVAGRKGRGGCSWARVAEKRSDQISVLRSLYLSGIAASVPKKACFDMSGE